MDWLTLECSVQHCSRRLMNELNFHWCHSRLGSSSKGMCGDEYKRHTAGERGIHLTFLLYVIYYFCLYQDICRNVLSSDTLATLWNHGVYTLSTEQLRTILMFLMIIDFQNVEDIFNLNNYKVQIKWRTVEEVNQEDTTDNKQQRITSKIKVNTWILQFYECNNVLAMIEYAFIISAFHNTICLSSSTLKSFVDMIVGTARIHTNYYPVLQSFFFPFSRVFPCMSISLCTHTG